MSSKQGGEKVLKKLMNVWKGDRNNLKKREKDLKARRFKRKHGNVNHRKRGSNIYIKKKSYITFIF